MYKFLTYDEWTATETVTDEEGNEVEQRTCSSFYVHPKARVNYEKTEVVVSCNCGDGTHTREEALSHIEANWAKPPEEVI